MGDIDDALITINLLQDIVVDACNTAYNQVSKLPSVERLQNIRNRVGDCDMKTVEDFVMRGALLNQIPAGICLVRLPTTRDEDDERVAQWQFAVREGKRKLRFIGDIFSDILVGLRALQQILLVENYKEE